MKSAGATQPGQMAQRFTIPFTGAYEAAIFLVVALGLAARLATLAAPHLSYPDEIFQYLEAAHRLVFGAGIIPWEYRLHIRSWLLPLLLAGPMWLGGVAAPTTGAYLLLPRLVLLTLSLSAVWAAHSMGRRLSPLHALFTTLVAATWYELVYYSTVALTEPVASSAFLVAAALFYRSEPTRRGMLLCAGALFTLVCLIRFQYAPGVATFVLAATARQPRQIAWLLAGAVPILLLSAAIDLTMGIIPFGWLVENVRQNLVLGRAQLYGVDSWLYPVTLIGTLKFWLVPITLLSWFGARRYPALMLAALMNFAVHNAIGHKEYRFILLTTTLVSVLAALGTADALHWATRQWGRRRHLTWIAAGGWLAASASIASAPPVRIWWTQQEPEIAAFTQLRDAPGLCGVAMFGFDWTGSGGYTYLHRQIPLFAYDVSQRDALTRDAAAFNRIVQPSGLKPPPHFRLERCFAGGGQLSICIYRRPGKCDTANPETEINRLLVRLQR